MGVTAERWLETYSAKYPIYKIVAKAVEGAITDSLAGLPVSLHSISARAKSPDSVAAKIKRKNYGRPQIQMTDIIGVRIITSYSRGVETVASRLKDLYEIDEAQSIDKRQILGINTTGYRSVHLIASLGKVGTTGEAERILQKLKVEIQIRSIIEHAWAEIEHELRYKSGVLLPPEVQRRFSVLAGTLELVDREFDALANELVVLVDWYKAGYSRDERLDEPFDSARLMGFFLSSRPGIPALGSMGMPLPFGVAAECVRILDSADLANAGRLGPVIESSAFRRLVREYADRQDVEPSAVSALVVVAAAIAVKKPELLSQYALLSDSTLKGLIS